MPSNDELACVVGGPAAAVGSLQRRLDAMEERAEQAEARLSAVSYVLLEGNDATKVQPGDYADSPALQTARELVEKAGLIDAPEIHDFIKAVAIEAAHQRARWPSEHDAGKADADWFWLIGYLGGKALHNPGGELDKQLHRIITVAAAACNWHAQKLGKTNMRPGIETPAE